MIGSDYDDTFFGNVKDKFREILFGVVASFGVLYGYRERDIEKEFREKEKSFRLASQVSENVDRELESVRMRVQGGLNTPYKPMPPRPEQEFGTSETDKLRTAAEAEVDEVENNGRGPIGGGQYT